MSDNDVIGIPNRSRMQLIPDVPHGLGREEDIWEHVLQLHEAKKAGKHFDLRLGDPKTGAGHSWALRRWPEPGDRALAVQQPTHTIGYFDFSGEIESGYGAGKVNIADRGKTEIIESSDDKIKFALYKGSGPEEYTLIRTQRERPQDWLLVNSTPTRKSKPEIPAEKTQHVDVKANQVVYDDPTQAMTAKIDGGHSIFLIEPKKPIRTFSYRTSKKSETGLIEHSHKIPGLYNQKGPDSLKKTVVRGEVWAKHNRTRQPLPAAAIGGMLNASVLKSREAQKNLGKLIPSPFDLIMYDGENVEGKPYAEKLELLENLARLIPDFELPDRATTPGQKREMLEKIENGAHRQTKEGVVLWDLLKHDKPQKVKFKHSTDVIIRGTFPGKGKYEDRGVGGFYYAYESDPENIVGRVGTGLTDELREDMFQNPQKYIGKVVKVEGTERYDSDGKEGPIRQPVFKEFHIDKDYSDRFSMDQERLTHLAKRLKERLRKV